MIHPTDRATRVYTGARISWAIIANLKASPMVMRINWVALNRRTQPPPLSLGRKRRNIKEIITRFSNMLLMGTVAHYYTNLLVASVLQRGGFPPRTFLPVPLLVISLSIVLTLLYFALLRLLELKLILLTGFKNESRLYSSGWLISIVLAILSIVLAIKFPNTLLARHIAGIGMVLAGIIFSKFRSG